MGWGKKRRGLAGGEIEEWEEKVRVRARVKSAREESGYWSGVGWEGME